MQAALRTLRDNGTLGEASGLITTFAERQRLVDKPRFDEMERRYATPEARGTRITPHP